KIAHDAKTATRAFLDLGVKVAGIVDDTMLAAFLLDCTQEAEPGEAVAKRLGGVIVPDRSAVAGRGEHTLEGVERERAAPWAGAITHAVLTIADELPKRLAAGGLDSLYRDVELPVAKLLAQIERVGIHIDADHFKRLGVEVTKRLHALE